MIFGTIYEGLLKCNWGLWRRFHWWRKKCKFLALSDTSSGNTKHKKHEKTKPRHIIIKWFKTNDKENKNLNSNQRKKHITYRKKKKTIADISKITIKTMQVRRQRSNTLNTERTKYSQTIILCPANIFQKAKWNRNFV